MLGPGPAEAESGEMSARGMKTRTESISLMEHASEMAISVSADETRRGTERHALTPDASEKHAPGSDGSGDDDDDDAPNLHQGCQDAPLQHYRK